MIDCSLLDACSDPGHIVAYTDGEIRQGWELILLGRPVSGSPALNDEASYVRWVGVADLEAWTFTRPSGGSSAPGRTAPTRTSTKN
jgi:hypothetical protein